MIEVTVNGVRELVGDLRNLPENLETKVIQRMSEIAYFSAQKGAGRHVKTGALFQSLYNRPIAGGRAVGHDANRAPHAVFVNFGTRPHEIRPKNKKALRWPTPDGFRFAKWVKHPGYRGDPYIIKAKDDALAQFDAIVRKSLQESI